MFLVFRRQLHMNGEMSKANEARTVGEPVCFGNLGDGSVALRRIHQCPARQAQTVVPDMRDDAAILLEKV